MTEIKRVELGDVFEYEQADGPEDGGFPTYIVYRVVQQILNAKFDVAAGRVVQRGGVWRLTPLNSGSCVNKMIGNIIDHIDDVDSIETVYD